MYTKGLIWRDRDERWAANLFPKQLQATLLKMPKEQQISIPCRARSAHADINKHNLLERLTKIAMQVHERRIMSARLHKHFRVPLPSCKNVGEN